MAKESSSELSSLAARVLGYAEMAEPQTIPAQQYNRLLEGAKRLAGSVLSQDETPGQLTDMERHDAGLSLMPPMPGEAVERAHDAASNQIESEEGDMPLPDAPSPVLMRVEFINIITAHSGGKISFNKAALMVDKIIARQMQYYAAMADPQMEADNREQLAIVMEAKGIIEALVRQAGASAEFMSDRQLWIRTAARARELAQKMEAMFS